MVATPWGNAEGLRDRRLPPGRGGDRRAARREQRERMFAAMVASCEEKGYEATSVEDLLQLSGVSRATFYEEFDDKADCFRAAEGEILAAALAVANAELTRDGDPLELARAGLDAVIDLIVAQPAAARMCLVDSYALGDADGMPRIREAIEGISVAAEAVMAEVPEREPLPLEVVRAIVGGFHQVIYGRLLAREEAALPELVDELWEWGMSIPAPPRPLRRPGRVAVQRPVASAPPFASYSVEQRIVRGFAAAVAEHGYPGATIAEIVAAAAVSQTTFYEHFEGKEDALSAALDSSGAQLRAAVLPPVKRVGDWRAATRVGFEEICGFFAAEPAFASLRLVDVYSAGTGAVSQRDTSGREVVRALLATAPESKEAPSDLVVEATIGAIVAILFDGLRRAHPEDLPRLSPLLTYTALAPFIGAEEAAEAAIARGRGGAA